MGGRGTPQTHNFFLRVDDRPYLLATRKSDIPVAYCNVCETKQSTQEAKTTNEADVGASPLASERETAVYRKVAYIARTENPETLPEVYNPEDGAALIVHQQRPNTF